MNNGPDYFMLIGMNTYRILRVASMAFFINIHYLVKVYRIICCIFINPFSTVRIQ